MNTAGSIARKMISAVTAAIMAVSCMMTAPFITSGEDAQHPFAEYADRIGVLVNQARDEAGLEPLRVVTYLNDCANVRARELIVKWDHDRPDGEKFSTVVSRELVPYSYIAENIAAGYSTPEDTFQQWKESAPHWAAILNPDVDYIGIGVTYDENSQWKWYWTQIFVDYNKELEGAYMPAWNRVVPQSVGDLTGDGRLNSFDYILLARYAVYKKDPDHRMYLNELQLESADVFADGEITISDAVVLKRYLIGRYTTLPVHPQDIL